MKALAEYIKESAWWRMGNLNIPYIVIGPILNYIDLTRTQFHDIFGTYDQWSDYLSLHRYLSIENKNVNVTPQNANMLVEILKFGDITKSKWKQIFGDDGDYKEYLNYIRDLEEFSKKNS